MAFGVSHKAWQMGRTAQQISATQDALAGLDTKEARLTMPPRPDLVGRLFCQNDTGELFFYVSSDLEPAEERWVGVQISIPTEPTLLSCLQEQIDIEMPGWRLVSPEDFVIEGALVRLAPPTHGPERVAEIREGRLVVVSGH